MQPISPARAGYLILLTWSYTAVLASASACYYAANDSVFLSPDYVTACGNPSATSGTLNCCDTGANNICLSNSLCYDPNINGGAYYLSPCTDRTYTAPECPRYCSGRAGKDELDVIYDYQAELWRCCSTDPDGSANCSNTTNETFDAPAPKSLSVVYPSSASNPAKQTARESQTSESTGTLAIVPTATDITSTPTSSTLSADTEVTRSTPTHSTSDTDTKVTHSSTDAASTPNATTASQSNKSSSNGGGLHTGAIIGISIGAVSGLGLLAAVGYWRLHVKRRRDSGDVPLQDLPVRPSDSRSLADARKSPASDSGETATTLPPRRDRNRV